MGRLPNARDGYSSMSLKYQPKLDNYGCVGVQKRALAQTHNMKIWKAFHLGVGFLKVLASEWPCDKHARFQHENLWSCAISSDSTNFNNILVRNSKTYITYSCTLRVNSPLMIMARWLLQLAFFACFVTGEIEENCNMQLQVAKTGNANQQKNGNSQRLPGYHVTVGSMCEQPDKDKDFEGLQDCAKFCGCNFYVDSRINHCYCCSEPLRSIETPTDTLTLYEKDGSCTGEVTTTEAPDAPPGLVVGDPHIQTLDGVRYTLLKQGTFSLWHLSGLKTRFHSTHKGIMQTVPVDWHVYAHYSGDKSFTKALLLVDKTGGSLRQVLEITSNDCIWKGRTADIPWKVIDGQQLIHKPEENGLYLSGFNVTGNHVTFNMNTEHGNTNVAKLVTSCRRHRHMDVKMKMRRMKYHQFVTGELSQHRKGLSILQTASSDYDYAISEAWEDLGGSTEAEYLQQIDKKDGVEAVQHLCEKHLGAPNGDAERAVLLEDCVYDICHGGEEVAQLAGELLRGSKGF